MKFNFDLKIDFHGKTVDEVIPVLEELFFVNSGNSIMIIHGRGSGALKKAVRDMVSKSPHIKSYAWGEDLNLPGFDGITVVYT
ncbi:MAG: hypothetical protein GY750_05570 [Lentisphaerae bacterium]|nr:hypothetical protein [Lentisphaerota bacterium]MCP4100880.1 hypothetical protein [Lentisphaerota bacterium]